MIYCNPRVIIEGGNATCQLTVGISDDGVGLLCVNSCELGNRATDWTPAPEDFNPQESEVVWVFKNIESLDVVMQGLNKIRSNMEAFEKETNHAN